MADKPIVVVTGATGFIAKWIILELLGRGYSVRGTVRDLKRSEEVLDAVRPALKGKGINFSRDLTFTALDLMRSEGWTDVMGGAIAVIHTAAPFPYRPPRDPDAVIRPAVEGTRRVLAAAHAAGVTKAVVTSSAVAVLHGHETGPGEYHFDEADWSNLDNPTLSPYNRAKTLAEKAAWEVAEETGMPIASVNPALAMGPLLDDQLSTSTMVVKQLLTGALPMLPDAGFGIVDVRDVAEMHANALGNPASMGKRHLAHADFLMIEQIAAHLANVFPGARIQLRKAPHFMVHVLSRFDSSLKQLLPDLGIKRVIDASAGRALLGHDFIPALDAILATAEALIERGIVRLR